MCWKNWLVVVVVVVFVVVVVVVVVVVGNFAKDGLNPKQVSAI